MMKRIVVGFVGLLAIASLHGCDKYENYSTSKAGESAASGCKEFNGKTTKVYIDQFARERAVKITCVNVDTGNTFHLEADGVKERW